MEESWSRRSSLLCWEIYITQQSLSKHARHEAETLCHGRSGGILCSGTVVTRKFVVFSHAQGSRRWECSFFQGFCDQVDQMP